MSIPVRNRRYMLPTSCGMCSAKFRSTDMAMKHVHKQHRPKRAGAPGEGSLFKVRWTRKGEIDNEIGLGMEMGDSWGSRGPDFKP